MAYQFKQLLFFSHQCEKKYLEKLIWQYAKILMLSGLESHNYKRTPPQNIIQCFKRFT